jgi:cobalt-zinc-cadmium efflux system outer membrane protein
LFSYRRGEASFMDFLDARRACNETTQSYNEARAEYARSIFLIDATIGRLRGDRPDLNVARLTK